MTHSDLIDDYLKQSSSNERIRILERLRAEEKWMPLSISQDLLCLKLSPEEHSAILRATHHKPSLAFEDFLTRYISKWNQNLASTALWEWALRSDRLLWHRTLAISADPHLPQRLAYTLLDLSWCGGGKRLVEIFANRQGLEDMSSAFLALLYFRAMQWNVQSDKLTKIAKTFLSSAANSPLLPKTETLYYLSYLYRFTPEWSQELPSDQSFGGLWTQFHQSTFTELQKESRFHALKAYEGQKLDLKGIKALLDQWPMVWERHKLSVNTLTWLLAQLSKHESKIPTAKLWDYFAGIPSQTLLNTLAQVEDEKTFLYSINVLDHLIDGSHLNEIQSLIQKFHAETKELENYFSKLPKRFSTFINCKENGQGPYDRAYREQAKVLSGHPLKELERFLYHAYEQNQREHDDIERGQFFDLAYRHHKPKPGVNSQSNYWLALKDAWQNPSAEKLDILSNLARQVPSVFQICYLNTLERFEGIDNVPLKLLDYIRNPDEHILRAVVHALAGVKTNRATQELVAFLTRPNVSFTLQMEITQLLQDLDLSQLQSELRSAINDLRVESPHNEPIWDLREALTGLLRLEAVQDSTEPSVSADQPTTDDLDQKLRQRIPSYDVLSGEAKRALRTAQFFHLQVSSSGNLRTIDLSPTIDMQYKALELSFREKFEEVTGLLIREGTLQRKLDIIGYARPIPRAMDDFERYIEKLDIINTIPFFSRFKLRKMLRAICQFRPGRRFTLDGLKAFALFFVCFSRKNCRYGLGNLLPIPSMSDNELLAFCKALHVFQDFRNRAAHEGFHPDASNDLEGIWVNTSTIIEGMIQIETQLKAPELRQGAS